MSGGHDPETLAFYEREAKAYAAREHAGERAALLAFMAALPAKGRVLELGCGGGRDAETLLAHGFDVSATDGSPEMAAIAQARIARPVRVMLFAELDEADAYDGVWANASLLHTPMRALADVLKRVRTALRSGGIFFASYKAGDGEGRDALGRYYNFPTRAALETAYAAAGPWRSFAMREGRGGGYDGVERAWLMCEATKL